jgi:hypothetical protein
VILASKRLVEEAATMKLRIVRGSDCPDGRTCPAVHESDRRTFVVVGSIVTDPEALTQLAIGPGEVAIEVPFSLLPEVTHA